MGVEALGRTRRQSFRNALDTAADQAAVLVVGEMRNQASGLRQMFPRSSGVTQAPMVISEVEV